MGRTREYFVRTFRSLWRMVRVLLLQSLVLKPHQIVPLSVLIGLAVPIPFWLVHKKWPKLGANKVVTPVLCWCLGYLSVGINTSVFTTFLLAIFSQFYLRRYRPRWFRKYVNTLEMFAGVNLIFLSPRYNFLLSAALDGGTQVMVFIYVSSRSSHFFGRF